jgi:alkanesulfonate monooxygenase SsuD/methylene tetrahydromethanopterin reductase-like flavin-dependent oxidoreductase (luciferase family)
MASPSEGSELSFKRDIKPMFRNKTMERPEVVTSTRERLGPVGVWLGVLREASIDDERRAARRIEQVGFGSIWSGELIGGKEAFAHHAVLLAATERIITGTGIANVWARHPATMQGGAATLGTAYSGRFVHGVGISTGPIVEGSGQRYERPLNHMVRYLDGMDAAASDDPVPKVPVPRVLAALGPQMLALARERADGAHPYFVPPTHTPIAPGHHHRRGGASRGHGRGVIRRLGPTRRLGPVAPAVAGCGVMDH